MSLILALKIVGAAILGVALLMVENSPSALRQNICSWVKWDGCVETLQSEDIKSAIYLGITALLLILIFWIVWELARNDFERNVIAQRPKDTKTSSNREGLVSKHDIKPESAVAGTDKEHRLEIEASLALLLISEDSAWMRWQDAQRFADNGASLKDDDKMHLAEISFRRQAELGGLLIKGRRRGEILYEQIPTDLWKIVYLDIEIDKRTLWRATIKARDGLEPEAEEQIPDYVSLQVSEERVKELWPAQDTQLDREAQLLLKVRAIESTAQTNFSANDVSKPNLVILHDKQRDTEPWPQNDGYNVKVRVYNDSGERAVGVRVRIRTLDYLANGQFRPYGHDLSDVPLATREGAGQFDVPGGDEKTVYIARRPLTQGSSIQLCYAREVPNTIPGEHTWRVGIRIVANNASHKDASFQLRVSDDGSLIGTLLDGDPAQLQQDSPTDKAASQIEEKSIKPSPDTTVCEAVNNWLLDQSQWGMGKDHNLALGELRQAAHNGDIAVWGRQRRSSIDELMYDGTDPPITQINKEYWLSGDFDPLHCLLSDVPNGCRTQPDAGVNQSSFVIYQDVRVNSRQLESRWPQRQAKGTR